MRHKSLVSGVIAFCVSERQPIVGVARSSPGLLVFRRFDIDSDGYLDTEEAQKALRYLGDVECAQTKTHTDSIIACVMPWSRS